MYDQKSANYNNSIQEEQASNTALDSATSLLFNYINGQQALIGDIEKKLHKILDRNVPQNPDPMDKKVSSNDFVTKLSEETQRIYNNNVRIENIFKHLSEII